MAASPVQTRWFQLLVGGIGTIVTLVGLYPMWLNSTDEPNVQVTTIALLGAGTLALVAASLFLLTRALLQRNTPGWKWGDAIDASANRPAILVAAAAVTLGCFLPALAMRDDVTNEPLPHFVRLLAAMAVVALVTWLVAWSVLRAAPAAPGRA